MSISFSQFLFFGLLLSLLFLTAVFGETPFGILIIGLFSVLFLVFQSKLTHDSRQSSLLLKISLGWVLWLLFLSSSLFTTLSIPLTVHVLLSWLFSFGVFLFFSKVDKKWMSWELISVGFIMLGVALSVFSGVVSLFPQLRSVLPNVNILVANYGHNHISVVALFLLPLVWQFWEKTRHKLLGSGLFIFFVTVLIMSLGRAAIAIGLLEISILFFKRRQFLSKQSQVLGFSFVALLLCTFAFLFSLTATTTQYGKEACNIPYLKNQLCKSISKEPRIAYWNQAVNAYLEKPVQGWGAGTFGIVSITRALHPYQVTSYVHNQFLTVFVEQGSVAGLYFLAIGILLSSYLLKVMFRKEQGNSFFISLSLIALLLDFTVDFDWEFLFVKGLFFISLAYLFFERKSVHTDLSLSKKTTYWMKLITLLSYLGVFIFVGCYLSNQVLWRVQNYNQAIQLYPFIYWQAEEKIGTQDISPNTQQLLHKLYKNHPNFLQNWVSQSSDPDEKEVVFQQLLLLQPERYAYSYLNFLAEQKNWSQFYEVVSKVNVTGRSEYLSDQEVVDIARWSTEGANSSLENEKFDLARGLYQQAYRLEPGIFVQNKAMILTNPFAYAFKMDVTFIDQWEIKYLGDYWSPMSYYYVQRFYKALIGNVPMELEQTSIKLLELDTANEVVMCAALEHQNQFALSEGQPARIITTIHCPR